MKIVHAVYSLEMGGAEVLVAQLARIQRAQGHKVFLFSYATLGVIGEALQAEGFDIFIAGEAHPLLTMLRYTRRFLALQPDVVHSHGIAPAIHATIPARLAGVPAILTTRHGLFSDRPGSVLRFNLMGWFCHWVTGICEVTCDEIRAGRFAPRDKVVCVYNGTTPVEPTSYEALNKRAFTLLFVGRVVPEKALEVLLRALVVARASYPDLALWIVGDGRSRAGLEALAAELRLNDCVTFWGQQLHTAPFFSAADIFAMSSIAEGLPMSLLQAMSLGTPALLTAVGGMEEVLRLTGAGLLAPPNDPEAFAAAILRLATEPTLRAELSQRAATAYQTHFTLAHMAAGYMNLYLNPEQEPT